MNICASFKLYPNSKTYGGSVAGGTAKGIRNGAAHSSIRIGFPTSMVEPEEAERA
jgi:hypothetical protein